MFRRLAALLATDTIRMALAGAAVSAGLTVLTRMAHERQQLLAELDQAVAETRQRLNDLRADAGDAWLDREDAKVYPTPEDLDPLGAGRD